MANLNMDAQQGRITSAQDVPTESNLGNKVVRPVETQKTVHGMFGDASGEMAAADAQMKTAVQINNVVQDGVTKLNNLQMAEEESKKQLLQQDWHVKEAEARSYAKEKALSDGLDTDAQQQLYINERDKRTSALADKYTFQTRVGNDVEQRKELWKNSADADYTNTVVMPRRVDNVKAGQIQALEGWSSALSNTLATETDPVKIAQSLQDNKNAVYNFVRSPQFVAANGAAAAEEIGKKYVAQMQTDVIATMTNQDPEKAVIALRNQTGDPATDPFAEMDPSLRHTMLYQAEKEASSRKAQAKADLKEKQDQREADLTLGILQGQISGNKGVAMLYQEYKDGKIDQSHFERLGTKLQADADRRERRALASEERNARAAEKRDAILQPARDAVETGLPLDPRNPTHVKAVNAYAAEALKNNPNQNPVDVLVGVTNKTGVAPKILTSTIYSRVMSKEPKEAIQGAQLVASLADKAPNIVHSLSDEVVTKANLIGGGVHPDQAQATIEKARTLSPEQKKAYEDKGKQYIPKLEGDVAKTLNIDKKMVTPEVLGHARDLFREQLYMTGGDVDAARESTKLLIHKNYGVSTVTGKPTVMYNAPEGANGPTKWMSDQLATDLKPYGIKPEQVKLKANTDGSYDLFALNDKGAITGNVVDPTSGKKLTWQPDQAAAAKAQRDAEEAAAQKKRDEYLKTTPNPLFNVPAVDSSTFVPRGMKAPKQVNTTEPKFGKY